MYLNITSTVINDPRLRLQQRYTPYKPFLKHARSCTRHARPFAWIGNLTLSSGVGSVISTDLVIMFSAVDGSWRKHEYLSKFRYHGDFDYVTSNMFQTIPFFFRNRSIFLFRVRTCFMAPHDYNIIPFAFQILIFLCHQLSWMMCFRIKCKWVNHQTVLTLTGRDAEDTTVMSFSLDLLAIGKSLHGRCCKPQLAVLLPRRTDKVNVC